MSMIRFEGGTWQPLVLTVAEAAEALRMSPKVAYRLIGRDAFPVKVLRVNGKLKVPTWAVMEYLGDTRASA